MLLGNKHKEDKKVGSLKKYIIIFTIVLVLIIIAAIMFFWLSSDKKDKEDYIEIFYRNKDAFEEMSNSLMSIEHEMSVFKESGKIVVKQKGSTIEITEYPVGEETKNNIKRAISNLGIRNISKTDTSLQFVYNSKKDFHGIVYAADKSQLTGFTNVEHLEGNWYYCYIFRE